tara:strand:+ start:2352 stop:2810 length:459 start_codon:yes stop_codon:yes gene_type:complete
MEVVLLENIKNLGQIGEIVKVKRGFGRNFLIKYGKALRASKENINLVSKKKAELSQKNLEHKKNAKKIFDLINRTKYNFSKRAKENGELYGSIKPLEITRVIQDLKKIDIEPSQIDLGQEIKKIGTYDIKINLHAEVQAKIHIEVVKEETKK